MHSPIGPTSNSSQATWKLHDDYTYDPNGTTVYQQVLHQLPSGTREEFYGAVAAAFDWNTLQQVVDDKHLDDGEVRAAIEKILDNPQVKFKITRTVGTDSMKLTLDDRTINAMTRQICGLA